MIWRRVITDSELATRGPKGHSPHYEWRRARPEETEDAQTRARQRGKTGKGGEKKRKAEHDCINKTRGKERAVRTRTRRLNHFFFGNFYPLKPALPSKRREDKQKQTGAFRREGVCACPCVCFCAHLCVCVCALICSAATLADFPGLNYHLAQTSGAPQHRRQTALSTCPQKRGQRTHLNKAGQRGDKEEETSLTHKCLLRSPLIF